MSYGQVNQKSKQDTNNIRNSTENRLPPPHSSVSTDTTEMWKTTLLKWSQVILSDVGIKKLFSDN